MCYTVCNGACKTNPCTCSGGNRFPFSLCMNGRKEMFYLTTHSTHFIYGYMASAV